MNRLRRFTLPLAVLVLLGVGFGGWLFGSGRFGGALDALLERRLTYVNAMQTVRDQRATRPELEAREGELVDRTLGASLESVDSRLRERLYALGSASGLADLSVVTSGTASARRGTPARTEFSRRGRERSLRDEIDFVEVGATVSGSGTLEQCLRLLASIDADPWLKRISQLQLKPDDNGARVRLTLRLVTLYLPGREPGEPPAPGAPDLARVTALSDPNPFRVPPPPPPPVAPTPPPPRPVVQTPPPPPPPPAFPYDRWVLTGVADGPLGPEAWLRNPHDDGRMVLRPGGVIGKAVLRGISGDEAQFELDEQTFSVRIGRSLQAGRDANL